MKQQIKEGGYCMGCGQALIKIGYFESNLCNPNTGKKEQDLELWRCPQKRFWSFGYHSELHRIPNSLAGMGIYP